MMSGHDVLMMPGRTRVEVFTGSHRRRRWSDQQKAAIVAESYETSVGEASARHGLSKAQLFNWRREARGPKDPLAFARVELDAHRQPCVAGSSALIEILSGNVLVRVGPGADASVLAAIIGALRAGGS